MDTIVIMAIAAVAVGGVKLGYGYLADRTQLLLQNSKAKRAINVTAGTALVCTVKDALIMYQNFYENY